MKPVNLWKAFQLQSVRTFSRVGEKWRCVKMAENPAANAVRAKQAQIFPFACTSDPQFLQAFSTAQICGANRRQGSRRGASIRKKKKFLGETDYCKASMRRVMTRLNPCRTAASLRSC